MYILVRAEPQYEALFGQEWDLYFFDEETGQLSPAEGLGAGFNPEGFYYYCDGLCNENDDLGIEYPRNMPEEAIPVQQTSVRGTGYDFTDNSKRDSWEKELDESKYAIWYKDELVTDFIYEECGSSSDGLLAVKQNGKWGYVDQNGEIVIPIEYDASWTEYDQYIRSTASSEQMDYCYAFSEGYVPVCKDGAWALMDSDGKKVIPEGIFEAIRPVQDGKCWVKKDGYWGVIQLNGYEADDSKDWSAASSQEIGEAVVEHLEDLLLEEGEGSFSVFESETTETDTQYEFLVRYSMSEEAAQEIIDSGGAPSANVLAGRAVVDKQTMEAVYWDAMDQEVDRWILE